MNKGLKFYRRISGIGQQSLALKIGAHKDYIGRLECLGKAPGVAYAERIVSVLNKEFDRMGIGVKITIEDILRVREDEYRA